MLRLALVTLALLGAEALGPAPALAHHGWSGYDASRLVTLQGTVQSVSYDNPHVLVMLRTADKTWRIVLAPPSRMVRRGLPDGSIKVEQAVSVQGYPHRQDQEEFRAERITANGATYELR